MGKTDHAGGCGSTGSELVGDVNLLVCFRLGPLFHLMVPEQNWPGSTKAQAILGLVYCNCSSDSHALFHGLVYSHVTIILSKGARLRSIGYSSFS